MRVGVEDQGDAGAVLHDLASRGLPLPFPGERCLDVPFFLDHDEDLRIVHLDVNGLVGREYLFHRLPENFPVGIGGRDLVHKDINVAFLVGAGQLSHRREGALTLEAGLTEGDRAAGGYHEREDKDDNGAERIFHRTSKNFRS
jgi:hypothetical protein